MNDQPLVSVVIPCYNHEQFVQDCIQSVIDQTYQNIELIIIDDGSSDGSVAKIQEMLLLCEDRFQNFEFRHRANKGLSATLNEAIEWCRGRYYSAIASDDMMCVKKTHVQVQYLEANKNCIAVFGGVELIDENSQTLGERLEESKSYTFEEIILNRHDLPASTQLARLNVIKEIGGYNENIKIEDWYMLLKMTEKNDVEVCYLKEILCKYRFHDENFSKNMKTMTNQMKLILEDYHEHDLYQAALIRLYRLNFSHYKIKKQYFNSFLVLLKLIKIKLLGK